MTPLRFAVLGHPNEGKSSIVSTLTENDRIRVSRTPGETTRAETYAIRIEGQPVLEILDTPGFQHPADTLTWFQNWSGSETEMLNAFVEAHQQDKSFHHDLELLGPLREGAGILYVVDSSRPLREVDRQEMELLRLTGLPRMALLNHKKGSDRYRVDWEEALKRRFNLVRSFNAHRATFAERVDLFEAMAVLNPKRESEVRQLRDALIRNWTERLTESAWILEDVLSRADQYQYRGKLDPRKPESVQCEQAVEAFQTGLRRLEARAREDWRNVFRHQELPGGQDPLPLAGEDLFAEKVWKVLGLTRRQLAGAGATAGAALGVGLDVATGGISFGVFTAGGALLGGISSWMGAPRLGAKSLPFSRRKHLSREELTVGPLQDPRLVFILLDRSLIYLHRLMNWSHGRRDHDAFLTSLETDQALTRTWEESDRKTVLRWRRNHRNAGTESADKAARAFRDLLFRKLSAPTQEPLS